MSLSLVTAVRSVAGAHRASNQDSAAGAAGFAFVADGVGGHAGGDVASGTVAHRLVEALAAARTPELTGADLRAALADANAGLAQRVRREPSLEGMATTFTGVFCAGEAARVVHIGDSRAYLWRDGAAHRVTRDDSLVQLLVEAGVVDPADAAHHPRRNVILHCLAGDAADPSHVTVLTVDTRPGDRWLMATDGLTDYVGEDRVLALLGGDGGPEVVADALVDAALDADAWDNVSVVVADVVPAAGVRAGEGTRLAGSAVDAADEVLDPTA